MQYNVNTNEVGGVSVFTPTVYRKSNGRIHRGYVADAESYWEGFGELKSLIRDMSQVDEVRRDQASKRIFDGVEL